MPGGKGGNQAVAAARLGAQVAVIGCIGDDSNGATLKAALETEGIDCAALATSTDAPTGVALIIVDDASQSAIVIVAGSNAQVSPATIEAQKALIARADVIVCQLETPPQTIRAALAAGRRLGRTTILNPAPAASKLPVDWFPLIDYLIPNELEAVTLSCVAIETADDARRAAEMLKAKGAAMSSSRWVPRACMRCLRAKRVSICRRRASKRSIPPLSSAGLRPNWRVARRRSMPSPSVSARRPSRSRERAHSRPFRTAAKSPHKRSLFSENRPVRSASYSSDEINP